ncbi:MAG TPA: outer membrane beta-barrel protein [Flavobacterium sp.]|jgi:hypothetical protein
MKNILSTLALAFFSLTASAQYGYRDANYIGIHGGINQFTLATNNFAATPGMGWNAGLSNRGNYYNNFDMVFALQFSENNFTVETTRGLVAKEVEYTIASAQLSLLLSYKIVPDHLSIELGPMVQVNGKATFDEEEEDNIVTGGIATVKEIADISNFSFYPTVGLTAGIRHVRLNVTYQYGVTNLLNKLNDQGFGDDFKGHASIIIGNLIVYF